MMCARVRRWPLPLFQSFSLALRRPQRRRRRSKVHCLGVNSCKGKADCHSPKNACKGMNSCKGQGWVFKETAAACEEAGGKALD